MYSGQTYQIPCDRGGLNHNQNIDLIEPEMMVEPTININLHRGGREKRGGTSVVNATPTTIGAIRIMGLHHYLQEDGGTFVLAAGNDAEIYYDDPDGSADFANTISGTNWTTSGDNHATIITAADLAIFNDGKNKPQTWDGTGNTADITAVATDWTGTNNPKAMIARTRSVDGDVAVERLWAYGCTSNPNRIYYGKTHDPAVLANLTDFSEDNTIDLITGDGQGIVGMIEYGNRLFAFGKERSFIIDDSSGIESQWAYDEAQWTGGASHNRVIIKTPYDLLAMNEDIDIYSVNTAFEYGDYKFASITRPSFIHEWIRDFVDKTKINNFFAVHDKELRAVKFFVQRKNINYIDTALVYFYDRGAKEGWSVQGNWASDSGFKASSGCVVKDPDASANKNYFVYTGGWDDGFIWKQEQTARNDNSAAYIAKSKTARLPFDNARVDKRYDTGRIVLLAKGDYNLDINVWVDAVALPTKTVSQAGTGSTYNGGDTYGVDAGAGTYGGDELIDARFDIGVVGKRIQVMVSNNNAGEDFYISQILIDHVVLGPQSA